MVGALITGRRGIRSWSPAALMAAAATRGLHVLPVLFKFGLVTVLARIWGAAPGTAIRTGLYLAQAGEFGFVLLALATERKLLPASLQSPVLASMVLSMLLTPIVFMYSNRIVMRLSASDWLLQSVAMTTIGYSAVTAMMSFTAAMATIRLSAKRWI
jgi:predicted Kef-type K+ transport protein